MAIKKVIANIGHINKCIESTVREVRVSYPEKSKLDFCFRDHLLRNILIGPETRHHGS